MSNSVVWATPAETPQNQMNPSADKGRPKVEQNKGLNTPSYAQNTPVQALAESSIMSAEQRKQYETCRWYAPVADFSELPEVEPGTEGMAIYTCVEHEAAGKTYIFLTRNGVWDSRLVLLADTVTADKPLPYTFVRRTGTNEGQLYLNGVPTFGTHAVASVVPSLGRLEENNLYVPGPVDEDLAEQLYWEYSARKGDDERRRFKSVLRGFLRAHLMALAEAQKLKG